VGFEVDGTGHERPGAQQAQVRQARELKQQNQVVVHISFQVAPMAVSIGRMTLVMNGG
jgi:hypothetical protein